MGRNLDELWTYGERIKGGFKCKFCHKHFAGGIARLKSHLAGIKGRDIGICDNVEKEVREEAFLAIKGSSKKAKSTVDWIVQDDGSNGSSSTKDLQQSAVSDLSKKENKGEVDHLLVKHLISNNIAFNVIETSPFQEFVRSVAASGPGYEVPSYSTLETKVIPDFKAEVDEYIKDAKKKWVTNGCTLMYDVRRDAHRRAVLNIVAYSSGRAVFMESPLISGDCVHIKDCVSTVIRDIEPHHVVQIITKPGSEYAAAACLLSTEYPRIYQTKCATHGIEQILKDIYKEEQWVREVIDNTKLIVSYMYEHNTVLSLMKHYTDNRELKHPCVTRFASNFKMLQSLLDVAEELKLLIASPEWGGLDYKGEVAKNVTSIIQNSDFWSQGREVKQVLEPLVQVLRLVEGEGSTSGYLYEAMDTAKEKIGELHRINKTKYKGIWDLFEKRQEHITQPIHTAAAYLNPSYMCSENFKDSATKDGVIFMLGKLVSEDERHSFMEQFQDYRAKVSDLFTDAAKITLKTSHPRIWWDFCGDRYPILKKYAIRILSQPCSSSFEQNWITFEAGETKKRNRFTPCMFDFFHLRMNMLMMEKYKTIETRDLKPIDLQNLSELPEYIDPPEEDWEDKVTNSTQENVNHDKCVLTANGCTWDHPVTGNVAQQRGSDMFDLIGTVGNSQTQTAQLGSTDEDIDFCLDFSLDFSLPCPPIYESV